MYEKLIQEVREDLKTPKWCFNGIYLNERLALRLLNALEATEELVAELEAQQHTRI